jgi:cell division protease FtsH
MYIYININIVVYFIMSLFLFLLSIYCFLHVGVMLASKPIISPRVLIKRSYGPFGQKYYENYVKNLNSKNITIQNNAILEPSIPKHKYSQIPSRSKNSNVEYYDSFGNPVNLQSSKNSNSNSNSKSENFEVIKNIDFSFKNIGGYDNIKLELQQCIDILTNYKKYEPFNVRIPKGLILEGPPGNGKTLIAKGFAGETNTSFIAISGSQFQEKYVGVGQNRVRELFKLASENSPCVIFIDEIDAVGRKRSSDGESSSSERDNTLNELLVHLDGFKTTQGLFLIGATNRIDLLDPALLRPGRIDKKIFIGMPDAITRKAILDIHLKGKPYNFNSINTGDLVEITAGLSGSQIENLLNEAMLNALRDNRVQMEYNDIDLIMNKMMVGWQPTEHQFTTDIIERIAIHEMGHAIVGFFSKHHSKMSKVIINLSAPKSPGYTMFESSTSTIFTREALFEHLMILLAGRIAEEIFYDVSVTTGAINDFEEAFKLAEKMIIYYGMGKNIIYPNLSDKYKEKIDNEVVGLINDAYTMSKLILENSKDLILECAILLKKDKILKADKLLEIITDNHGYLLQ